MTAAPPGPADVYARNVATSYGLTLVAGAPLPAGLTRAVLQLQRAVEQAARGRFEWYAAPSLHVTLAAPLRGRYRATPPLRRAELPAQVEPFFADLAALCAALPPLDLALGAARLHRRTLLVDIHGGVEHVARLAALIASHPGWDPPKGEPGPLHLSAGFLRPGADEDDAARIVNSQAQPAHTAAARLADVALIHYANRTLATILGPVRLPLGQASPRPPASFLAALNVLD